MSMRCKLLKSRENGMGHNFKKAACLDKLNYTLFLAIKAIAEWQAHL